MSETDADLIFLPWVQRGAAATLQSPDTLGPDQPGLATAAASVQVNTTPTRPVPVTVLGPGHVTGLDRRQVIRTDPAPDAIAFESNYFPLIELDEPALPWLFTPAAANAQARLRPWLCLVVIRQQDGVRLTPPQEGPLPVLSIGGPAKPADELPNLADSWAWAHGQLTAKTSDDLAGILASDPDRSVARLVCPRILRPDTAYLACVVPAFELGRKTGLGLPVTGTDEAHLKPAWELAAASVELPVYHSWSFTTGAGGDFQSLAMLLRARPVPDGVGVLDIDVSDSGLGAPIPAQTTMPLRGALQPMHSPVSGWEDASLQATWEQTLVPVLNAPALVPVTDDPLLAPPLYGAAQAGLAEIDPTQSTRWFEQLNLSPAHRAVAHLGTLVVQTRQDELMASAWNQAAELARVNQLLRQVELGRRISTSLHTRHIVRMDAAVGLQVLGPALPRMTRAAPNLAEQLAATGLAASAFSVTLRRLARPRGAVNRRVQRVSSTTVARTTDMLFKLQPVQRIARTGAPHPTVGPVTLERVGQAVNADVSYGAATEAAVAAAPKQRLFAFVPMGTRVPTTPPWDPSSTPTQPVPAHPLPPHPPHSTDPDPASPPDPADQPDPSTPHPHPLPPHDSDAARLFRTVAEPHLHRFNPERAAKAPGALLNGSLAEAFAEGKARTNPMESFAIRVRAAVTIPGPPREDSTALDPVRLSPSFPQPMVEPLTEVAQRLVLPSLDLVPPNTVVPLETNTAFVESYLVGLNTEMGRELLWRGYPADLAATYFNRFWDASSSPGRASDVDNLDTWGARSLGTGPTGEDFVLLVRSELLRRYPDAIIYAMKAGVERHPIFSGGFPPDIRYFGFDILADDIGGWDIVIQEHPAAPRFGVEVGTDMGTATHAAPSGADAAFTAHHFRQLPVRISIPATVLMRTK